MNPNSAAENLQVIRTLLERARTYRAISAPAALTSGILGVALATKLFMAKEPSSMLFLVGWLILLAIGAKLNGLLIWKEAATMGRKFLSPEFKLAVQALAPGMLAGGVIGILAILLHGDQRLAVLAWILGYGTALRSTQSFSPRSIKRLGLIFLGAGTGFAALLAVPCSCLSGLTDQQLAAVAMGITFGLCHIIYAAAIFLWPQGDQTGGPSGDV